MRKPIKYKRGNVLIAEEATMTHQQAIKILMLSPVYYRLGTLERMELVKEYCKLYGEIQKLSKKRTARHS